MLEMTVDEIVSTLKHSHVPSVVVEGTDDVLIYRWLEERINVPGASIFPCFGRENLLKVFARRHEFSHLRTAFVADLDMWLFDGVPQGYDDLIFTVGYSIENDLLAGSQLEDLLDQKERISYDRDISVLVEWFAFEVEEYLAGSYYVVDVHPNRIIPIGAACLEPGFAAQRGYRKATSSTSVAIAAEYKLRIRGKNLFQLLGRYLNAKRRACTYSVKSLYEIACKTPKKHPFMERIVNEITLKLT